MSSKDHKVFISHAREDKDRFVLEFAKRLRSHGVDAWVDIWEMLPGDRLVDKIFDEGIKNARAMIVVLSENSIDKPWVKEELSAGFIKRISGKYLLIPVVIDDCEVPEALRTTLWQTIPNINSYDEEFTRILNAIYGRHQKPPLGPPGSIVLRQQIRDDLSDNQVPSDLSVVDYTIKDIEDLIMDKYDPPTLRLQALQYYLNSDLTSNNIIKSLTNDPDKYIKHTILRYIHRNPNEDLFALFDEKEIKRLLDDPDDEIVVASTRLACDLSSVGILPWKILTYVNKHPYWLVRRIAIRCIVESDDPKTLELLHEFRTTSYHVSQQYIRDFIENNLKDFYEQELLNALELLEGLKIAKRASDKSKSKTQDLIDKIETAN